MYIVHCADDYCFRCSSFHNLIIWKKSNYFFDLGRRANRSNGLP